MMKFRFIFIIALFLSYFTCSTGEDIPENICLPVPYRAAERANYCAVACIQMWALYDGNTIITQDEIARRVGAPTLPSQVQYGVGLYTDSPGYLFVGAGTEYYQDRMLSMSVAAFLNNRPTIIPVHEGDHAVIMIGYTYHYVDNNIPIADKFWLRDPNGIERYGARIAEFKSDWFLPDSLDRLLRIILPASDYVSLGDEGYITFLDMGGSYSGGPTIYEPSQEPIW